MEANGTVLLTGAGFTHNFGAPLAAGLWALIFNHRGVQSCSRIRDLMLHDFDYESIYHAVMTGDEYSEEEKEAVATGVGAAY